MKKPKKSMIILFSILAVIGITIGGCSMHQYQKKQEMIAIATSDEAKKVYEHFMKSKDPKAFIDEGIIKNYEIDESSLSYNPMGGLMVSVIINKDNELNINYNLIENKDGSYHSAYYSTSPKLSKLLKGNNE